MVSGFVTSPDDHSRICLGDARPIRMASKSLISINGCSLLLRNQRDGRAARGSLLELPELRLRESRVLVVSQGFQVVLGELLVEPLVGRDGQIAVAVDAV